MILKFYFYFKYNYLKATPTMHIISINSALYIGDAHLGGAVLLEDARLGRDLRHPRHVRLQAGAALARIRRGLLLRVDTAAATAAAATQRDGRSFIVHLITIRKTRSRDYIYIYIITRTRAHPDRWTNYFCTRLYICFIWQSGVLKF